MLELRQLPLDWSEVTRIIRRWIWLGLCAFEIPERFTQLLSNYNRSNEMTSSIYLPICASIVGVLIFSILYIFSDFSYELSTEAIIVRWVVLGGIPFGKRQIAFKNIKGARRYSGWRDVFGAYYIAGNLFVKPAVVVFLKHGLIKRVFLTPPAPNDFIKTLESRK